MAAKPMACLGISYGHGDSSAALVVDGRLVAAAEEERFTRVKHYALFPAKSIAYCLKHAGLDPRNVRIVAVARRPWNAWWRKALLLMLHPQPLSARRRPIERDEPRQSLESRLRKAGLTRAHLYRVEHHHAHLASARPLSDAAELALFSFDGLGDFVSTTFGKAEAKRVDILERVFYPHSLGFFYTAMTQYLGFPHFGDEFKVMGLSAYGRPRFLDSVRKLVRERNGFGFELNLEALPIFKTLSGFHIDGNQPKCEPLYNSSYLTQILGLPPRKFTEPLTRSHWDLARSVQVRFEEIASHCLRRVHEKLGGEAIGIAGGCAHNSVWVGKIPQQTPFKNVHVAPASNDAGIAVGAAILAAHTRVVAEGGHWGLLGPDETDGDGEMPELKEGIATKEYPSDEALADWMAAEIAAGKIVGLCRGRMEFGPRALGSRSILADPRVAAMRERLNHRVKHREPFRPFAASVLWEYQKKWFKGSFHCPSMEAVFEVEESVRNKIPAVVHVDNSCRVQSVRKETQPFYWLLIEAFRKKSGVPLLLNTSFNDNEPIVCSPADALRCFQQTEMDHLVIGRKSFSRARSAVAVAV